MSGAALRAAASDFFAADEALVSGACAKSANAKLRAMQSLPAVEIMMFSIDGRGGNSVRRGNSAERFCFSDYRTLPALPGHKRILRLGQRYAQKPARHRNLIHRHSGEIREINARTQPFRRKSCGHAHNLHAGRAS